MNKRVVGAQKEEQVCQLLIKHGYEIIERNFRVRQGEIDIIAKDGEYLVFVEVKFRKGTTSGDAAMAVNYAKQKQISKVALFYLSKHKIADTQPIRFDVVAVDGKQVHIYQNAFEFCL